MPLAVISIALLAGRGSSLIAGFNTASEDEKAGFDKKKLCRITGGGLSFVTILLFVFAIWDEALPNWFGWTFAVFAAIDSAVVVVLANTMGKKRGKKRGTY